ncbi:MAG: TlpA family protein disulfide reductase [Actinomycetia bacterium]|nr:TlpA family protein disulfide reductase [Actinomycetes bacterium]
MAKTGTGSKTGIIAGVIGAGLVLLLISAVLFGNSEVGSEFGEPTIEGVSLPPMPQNVSQDASANGLTAPTLSGVDYSDTPVVIGDDGRAKGVVFLAHWCGNCQQEVPRVQAWIDAGGDVEDVDLYSVTTSVNSGRPNYPPSAWLESEGWTVPVVRDDQAGSAHRAYGGGGFPYWVFTNSDGTVAMRVAGQIQTPELVAILESLS